MMRDPLAQVKRLLTPDGSVWVHLDDNEVAYCRVLLDELFGRENFVATIIWQKSYTRENRKAISIQHDYIHVYAPSAWAWKEGRAEIGAALGEVAPETRLTHRNGVHRRT